MSPTEKQREYIEYMLTNRFTDEKDQESLKRHLKNTGKHDFTKGLGSTVTHSAPSDTRSVSKPSLISKLPRRTLE